VSPSFEENRFVKGEIAVVQEIIDSPKVEIIAIPDVEKMVMGKMKYVPTEDIPIEEETLAEMVKEDTAIVKTSNLGTVEMDKGKNVILSRDIHANLFPNPTADHLEIVLTVPENIRAEITLISLSGDVLAEIYEGELPIGEMRFNLNLSDYATGTYIVAIQASGFRKYVKVQKIG
jgi:hypothetical protein